MGQPNYYNENGEPIYIAATHMLQPKNTSKKKLFIELLTGTTWNSLDKIVTLKVDTETDENVMNEHTFRSLFKDGQLESPSIILESYGNANDEAIGKFICFPHCKGKVYRTVFHVTTTNNNPNLLSRENSILFRLTKPCFIIQSMTTGVQNCSFGIQSFKDKSSTLTRVQNSYSDTQSSTVKKETLTGLPSIDPDTVTQCPFTKEIIMDTYKDVFTGIVTFSGDPYQFKLKSNATPARHAPRKVPIHVKDAFCEEVHNLVKLGILEKFKLPTE